MSYTSFGDELVDEGVDDGARDGFCELYEPYDR